MKDFKEKYKSKILCVMIILLIFILEINPVCGKDLYLLIEPKYKGEVLFIGSKILIFRDKDLKVNIVNVENSKVIYSKNYSEINPYFSNNLIKVKYKGKYGFIDKITGLEIVPPKYDYVEDYSDYFNNLVPFKIGNKCGLINKTNGKEILPLKYYYDSFSSVF